MDNTSCWYINENKRPTCLMKPGWPESYETGYDCPLVVVLVHYKGERSYSFLQQRFCAKRILQLKKKPQTKYLHTSNDRHIKSDSFISSCHLLAPLVWGLWMWSSWDVSARWSTSSPSSPKLTRWPWRREMTSSRRWEDCDTVIVDAHVCVDGRGASANVTKMLQQVPQSKWISRTNSQWAPTKCVCIFATTGQ